MVDYTTMRVPTPDYENAKESKKDSETWGEFLQRCTEQPPEIVEYVDTAQLDELLKCVEQIQSAQGNTVKEALEIAEGPTEIDLTPVLNRLDDLETELTNQHERLQQ